ncbi:hypothetical protein E3N88_09740 [Mikania micrantha]|uniref:Pectinesterase inhibitor domain-containing protein n=1 Tax=Mikania micrantha TaxID=192012 RepID=A0A5N6PJZ6_9ASTR|nr:hypothetical protein E3N88_09740 [Mikania micrantha]
MVASQTKEANLANKQLEGIEHKIEEFKTILTKREEGSASESSKNCLVQCQENLEEAIDGVKMGIESINDQDLEKANVDISGISTDVETCNDCFIELDVKDKDINAFTEWILAYDSRSTFLRYRSPITSKLVAVINGATAVFVAKSKTITVCRRTCTQEQ